jgi:hypothetical protein
MNCCVTLERCERLRELRMNCCVTLERCERLRELRMNCCVTLDRCERLRELRMNCCVTALSKHQNFKCLKYCIGDTKTAKNSKLFKQKIYLIGQIFLQKVLKLT